MRFVFELMNCWRSLSARCCETPWTTPRPPFTSSTPIRMYAVDRRQELPKARMSFSSSLLSSSVAPANGYWSRLKSRLELSSSWSSDSNSPSVMSASFVYTGVHNTQYADLLARGDLRAGLTGLYGKTFGGRRRHQSHSGAQEATRGGDRQ